MTPNPSDSPRVAGHTPGKWEVAHHGTTPGNTSVEVQTTTGLPIAVMSYCGRAEENAALIASAPNLLLERDALRAERAKLRAALRELIEHGLTAPNLAQAYAALRFAELHD